MIGGRIIHMDGGERKRLWVCQPQQGEMCVHAENDRGVRWPEIGEEIWWQSGRIMFGGSDPKHGEISLRKVGNSHSPEACRKAVTEAQSDV